MVCAYCFGRIIGEAHVVRGRSYHPPVMQGKKSIPGTGCAAKDACAKPAPAKVDPGQTTLC